MSDENSSRLEKRFDRLETNFLEVVERVEALEAKYEGLNAIWKRTCLENSQINTLRKKEIAELEEAFHKHQEDELSIEHVQLDERTNQLEEKYTSLKEWFLKYHDYELGEIKSVLTELIEYLGNLRSMQGCVILPPYEVNTLKEKLGGEIEDRREREPYNSHASQETRSDIKSDSTPPRIKGEYCRSCDYDINEDCQEGCAMFREEQSGKKYSHKLITCGKCNHKFLIPKEHLRFPNEIVLSRNEIQEKIWLIQGYYSLETLRDIRDWLKSKLREGNKQ